MHSPYLLWRLGCGNFSLMLLTSHACSWLAFVINWEFVAIVRLLSSVILQALVDEQAAQLNIKQQKQVLTIYCILYY